MEPARKRGRSDMWEHFNLIAPDKVRCLVCSAELKYHGNTSSMIRHFTAKHGAALNQGNTNQVDRKRELDEALVNMVVKDSQPFSIVDDWIQGVCGIAGSNIYSSIQTGSKEHGETIFMYTRLISSL